MRRFVEGRIDLGFEGGGFVTAGGGVRFALSPRAALMGGLRINMAFGNDTALSLGPELGVMFGF